MAYPTYATVEDVQSRMSGLMSDDERQTCATMLEDAAMIIDAYNVKADPETKQLVSCRMVVRALGDGTDTGIPIGATQGSMSALGYSQSWTVGGSGTVGELYLGKLDKKLLGVGNSIGSHSPLEDLCKGGE